jgi:putative Holliday junction resolvase
VTLCKASKKFLGLDYGEKTIGVALSLNGRVATGVKTLRRKDAVALRPSLKELKIILREHGISQIILGFPKHLNGENSPRCEETLAFKQKLERYFKNITVTLWDERLSTLAVSRVFEGKRVNYKKNVDTMAAVYILQGFLDYKNGKETLMSNEPEIFDENEFEDDVLVVTTEDGEERQLQIVSCREDEKGIYLLAIDAEEGEAYQFKCPLTDSDDEDVMLEAIDGDHEDFNHVMKLFKDDYEEYGIDVEDFK